MIPNGVFYTAGFLFALVCGMVAGLVTALYAGSSAWGYAVGLAVFATGLYVFLRDDGQGTWENDVD